LSLAETNKTVTNAAPRPISERPFWPLELLPRCFNILRGSENVIATARTFITREALVPRRFSLSSSLALSLSDVTDTYLINIGDYVGTVI